MTTYATAGCWSNYCDAPDCLVDGEPRYAVVLRHKSTGRERVMHRVCSQTVAYRLRGVLREADFVALVLDAGYDVWLDDAPRRERAGSDTGSET